jgi:hypothetical protein
VLGELRDDLRRDGEVLIDGHCDAVESFNSTGGRTLRLNSINY